MCDTHTDSHTHTRTHIHTQYTRTLTSDRIEPLSDLAREPAEPGLNTRKDLLHLVKVDRVSGSVTSL